MDPVALSLLPKAGVPAPHLLYDHDGEVVQGVARSVEVGCYWLICAFMFDITSMSIEADVEGVQRLSHILLLASPAFYEIDDIAHLAGGCGSYVEVLAGGGTHECVSSPDVLTCEAASVVAWTAPLVGLTIS